MVTQTATVNLFIGLFI